MTEFSLVVRASIVLVVSLAVVMAARRSAAAWRAWVLSLTFGVLLALPLTAYVLPPVTVVVPIAVKSTASSPSLRRPTTRSSALLKSPPAASVTRHPRAMPLLSLASVVRAIWIAGALLVALPLALTLRMGARVRRDAMTWTTGEEMVLKLATESGLRHPVDLKLHPGLTVPMTSGFVRPTIYLPVDAPQWPQRDVMRAVTHELEHVRRGDWLVLLLTRLAASLYWFHPLAWLAWRRLRLEIERACDDGVVHGGDRTAYAEQLVALARRVSSSAPAPLAPMAHRSDLARRVAAVLDADQRRGRVSRTATQIGVAIALALLLIVASTRIAASPVPSPRAQPAQAAPADATHATLTGIVYDPLGAPVEGMSVSMESGPFGSGVFGATRTDKAGRYTFERLPPGVYVISAPVDFAPTITVSLNEGQRVEQDVRLEVDGVAAIYSVCIDCPQDGWRYTPPQSIVAEFARDREVASQQSSTAAEPVVGWDFYEPDVRITDAIRARGLTGDVVLEGRIDIDGAVRNLSVTSSSHRELSTAALAALDGEKWRPATVHGVSVAVPLRLTIEFRHRGGQR
jgi:TonB family protein